MIARRALSVRSAYAPRLAGGTLYYISDVTGEPQLWTWRDGRHDVAFPWEGRVGDYRVSPGGRVAFAGDVDGDERWRIYIAGEDLAPVATEGFNSLGDFSPDGAQLAYTSTAEDGVNYSLYIYGPGGSRLAARLEGINQVAQWTEAGILLVHWESNLDSDVLLYRDGQLRNLTRHQGEALNLNPRLAGGRLLFLTNVGSEYLGLASLDLSTGDWKYLLQLDRDIEAFEVSGSYLAFATNEDGRSALHLMHLPSGLIHRIDTPPGVVTGLDLSGTTVAFSLSGIGLGHEVYLYQGAPRRVTSMPRYGLQLEAIPQPQTARYRSHDGREIPVNLYSPPGAPRGAVVYLHGGPESQDRPDYRPLLAALLLSGFLVAAPNYRGSTGYGKTYVHLDDGERRWDAIADVGALAAWLEARGFPRPCVVGGSYGGYLTLMALAMYPEAWSCGVEIVGIVNLVTFLENTAPWRRRYREAEYGSLQNRDLLLKLSPITYVDRIRAPLMVVHGANDPRVPVGEAEQLVARLRELGRPVEYIRLPDEGHGISKVHNRVRVYGQVLQFVERHLR